MPVPMAKRERRILLRTGVTELPYRGLNLFHCQTSGVTFRKSLHRVNSVKL